MELDRDSIKYFIGGNPIQEINVSVSFPKNVEVNETMIEKIIEDSIKNVFEKENISFNQENITVEIGE